MKTIVIASFNKHKIDEFKRMLPSDYQAISALEAGINEEPEETGVSFEENARIKARFISERCNFPCLADDSGLEVEALNGDPGVHSARYAGSQKSDTDNVQKLLENLANTEHRIARFRTVLAYISDGETHLFEGEVRGRINRLPAGKDGFGYDPVFIADGETRTFAEMSPDEKNAISHRKKAMDKFVHFLANT